MSASLPPSPAGETASAGTATPPEIHYPSVDPGIPALSVDALLGAHQGLLDRIKLCFGMDRAAFDQAILPLLRRYAAYVHLLPCTADNYASAPGGLLDIGLETAFYALQGTDAHIFSGRATISERHELEPRWRLATFIAGLCCELHRPISHISMRSPLILLAPDDDVAVAREALASGTVLPPGAAPKLTVLQDVPAGHKLALRDLALGQAVHKYGRVIGKASQAIQAGEHVHVHNLAMVSADGQAQAGTHYLPVQPVPAPACFQGFVRADGRVGTRNYLGVIASVNCSATVCKHIAQAAQIELADFVNVDGVVAITHGSGCGMAGDGDGLAILQRTLRGYADHPNFAGVLVVGLGCEVNQIAPLVSMLGQRAPGLFAALTIQEQGGTRESIAAGLALLRDMMPLADQARRQPVPACPAPGAAQEDRYLRAVRSRVGVRHAHT